MHRRAVTERFSRERRARNSLGSRLAQPVKVPSPTVRIAACTIRVLSWLSALVALPFVIVAMIALTANGEVGEIFRGLRYFFRTLYSGHLTRPFILPAVSKGKTTLPPAPEVDYDA